jgi:hypothetical protein
MFMCNVVMHMLRASMHMYTHKQTWTDVVYTYHDVDIPTISHTMRFIHISNSTSIVGHQQEPEDILTDIQIETPCITPTRILCTRKSWKTAAQTNLE